MGDKSKGFVPVYRCLKDTSIWNSGAPFDDRSAWIDLLLSVNHEEKKIIIDRQIVVIKPGQMWTSYQKLSNRWKWSKERVFRYTKMLKNDGMISINATPRGTLLTLINWGLYNNRQNTDKTANETANETAGMDANKTAGKTQTIMINNENNVNNENKRTAQISEWGPRQ